MIKVFPRIYINTNGVEFPKAPENLKNFRNAQITIASEDLTLSSAIEVRHRGNTTLQYDKRSYRIKLPKKLSVLGMPANKDWILYGPCRYDRVRINNPLVYSLSRQMGRYAPRTQWSNLFLNDEYRGLYVVTETIKRGKNRVDIEKGGGWIQRMNKLNFRTIYPKPYDLSKERAEGIAEFVNDAWEASYTPKFVDFFDTWNAIDYHLLNTLVMSNDAFRENVFMSKRDDGRLKFGPVWDYDKALTSEYARPANPHADLKCMTRRDPWKGLFQQPDFMAAYKCRWGGLRKYQLTSANIESTIDALVDEIKDQVAKDYRKYERPRQGARILNGTFGGEIKYLKWFLSQRLDFMDESLLT